MASRTVDDTETILADLKLTRGLTIQMTAIGTLGMIVGWAVFSILYQMATGHVARFQFAPAGIGWWTDALNVVEMGRDDASRSVTVAEQKCSGAEQGSVSTGVLPVEMPSAVERRRSLPRR